VLLWLLLKEGVLSLFSPKPDAHNRPPMPSTTGAENGDALLQWLPAFRGDSIDLFVHM
jgi:hypothetical protein